MKVVTLVRACILGLMLLAMSVQPAMADVRHTKQSAIGWVMGQTKGTVPQSSVEKIVSAVFREAKIAGLDPYMVLSIMAIESRFNAKAKNPSGASGLLQVIPRWHRDKIRGRNIMDVDVNVEVGIRVFSDCMDRVKDNVSKALRCYLGGSEKQYAAIVRSHHDSLRKAEAIYRFERELPVLHTASFLRPKHVYTEPELPLLAQNVALAKHENAE